MKNGMLMEQNEKPDFFEFVENCMEKTGCPRETAEREYQALYCDDYDPMDWECDC